MPEIIGASKNISGFDPRSIGSCRLWLDSADASTLFSDSTGSAAAILSGTVGFWKDKSTSATNVSNATSGQRPTYTSNGLSYAGAQGLFGTPTTFSSGGLAAFVVFNPTTPSTRTSITQMRSGLYFASFETTFNDYMNPSTYRYQSVSPLAGKNNIMSMLSYSSAEAEWAVNVATSSTTWTFTGSPGSGTTLAIGSRDSLSLPFVGTISEVIMYDGFLTLSQKQAIEGYLAWKWGLEVIPQAPSIPGVPPPGILAGIPTDIGGCVLWLDAADSSTFTLTGSSNVTQWRDKSGKGYNTTTTGSVVVAPNYKNSRSAITIPANAYATTSTMTYTSTYRSMFIVADVGVTTGSTQTGPFSLIDEAVSGATSITIQVLIYKNLGGTANLNYIEVNKPGTGVIGTYTSGLSTLMNTGMILISIQVSTATRAIYVNGTSITPLSTNSGQWTAGSVAQRVGSTSTQPFTVGEVLIYDSDLTNLQRQQIEGYLSRKWAITVPTSPAFTGLSLWLDASDTTTLFQNTAGTTPVTADGQSVACWKDKSGNGYLFTQATALNQPTFKSAAMNGGNTLRWNGTSMFLQSSSALPFFSTPSSGGTFFFVFNATAINSQRFLMHYQNATSGTYCVNETDIGYTTGATAQGNFGFHRGCGNAVVALNQINQLQASENMLMTGVLGTSGTSPANVSIFKNGRASTVQNDGTGYYSAGSYPSSNNARFLNIGSRNLFGNGPDAYHSGDIAEIIWFNIVLTTTQRQEIESYLSTKWGIPMYGNGYTQLLNSPLNVPGCTLWLDGTDPAGTGISPSNGTSVSTWVDKSGRSNNATSVSGSGVFSNNAINSTSAIYMSNAPQFRGSFSTAITGSNITVITVATTSGFRTSFDRRLVSLTRDNSGSFLDYNTTTGIMPFDIQTSNFTTYYNGNQVTNTFAIAIDIPFIASMVAGSGVVNAWFSGAPFTTTGGTGPAANALNIGAYGVGGDAWTGGGECWFGYIGEVLIYSNALNTTQRQTIERYLSLKWGLSNFYTSIPGSVGRLMLWLDGADGSTMTFPSGSNVSGWKDKAAMGFTLSNTISGQYPTYIAGRGLFCSNVDAGVNTSNQGFRYDGNWTSAVPTQSMTAFISFTALSNNGYRNPLFIGATNGGSYATRPNFIMSFEMGASQSSYLLLDNSGSWGQSVNVSTNTSLGPRIDAITSLPGATSGWIIVNDREQTYSSSNAYTSTFSSYMPNILYVAGMTATVQGARNFHGYINEILFYSNALTSNERSTIQSYLALKWNNTSIPTAVLPLAHPFTTIRPSSRYFNPIDVPGCILWLDAMDTSTFNSGSITNGAGVTSWRDKSGLGNGANTTTTNKPTWSSACNAVQFVYTNSNGIGGFLNTTYSSNTTVFIVMAYTYISPYTSAAYPRFFNMSSNSTFPNTGNTFHLYGQLNLMFEYNGYSNPPYAWTPNANGPNSASGYTYACVYFPSPGSNPNPTGLASGTNLAIANAITVNTSGNGKPFIYTNASSWNGTTLTVNSFSNDYQASSSKYSGGITTGGSSYGANYNQYAIGNYPGLNAAAGDCFNGYIHEIVVYSNVLTSNQIQVVQQYLARKWNIYSATPSNGNTASNFTPSNIIYSATAVPFLPTNISGCAVWLDGADATSMTLSGSNVMNWRDKSGNGYAAISQTTPATLVSSSFGGNTSLLFNGASRYFCPTSAISNSSYTIFTVQMTTSASGGGAANGYQRVINANNYAFVGVLNGNVAMFTGSGSAWNDSTSNIPSFYNVNINSIVSMSVSNTVLTPYVNGNVCITKTGTTGAFSNFYIGNEVGGTQPWYGNISEIIVYNGILTTNQRQQVEGYLAWKWGLVSSLNSFVRTGLTYHLDAGNTLSYPGSGTTWSDLVGTGVVTTLVNGPSYSSTVGGSITFTPASSHYAATATEFQTAAYSNWTVEVWMSPTNTYTGTNPAIVTQKYPSTINYVLGVSAGVTAPNVGVGFFNGAWYYIPTGYAPTTNVWAQFVGTYDGADLKLHVNGNPTLSTPTTASSTWANNGGIYLMRRWDSADYFGGSLAIVRIYNRALSTDEISKNFNAQRARFSI